MSVVLQGVQEGVGGVGTGAGEEEAGVIQDQQTARPALQAGGWGTRWRDGWGQWEVGGRDGRGQWEVGGRDGRGQWEVGGRDAWGQG